MPIYAFECDSCGHAFDRLQKLSDPDPTECPACAQPRVRRQLTAPMFRLAGSGWYETDFKKDGEKKRNLAQSDDKPARKDGAEPPAKADKPAAEPKPAAPKAAAAGA